jgi:ferredoxin
VFARVQIARIGATFANKKHWRGMGSPRKITPRSWYQETAAMAHVVVEPCIDCKSADCVAVCPVHSFREGERMMFIHPDECIDCEACVAECPAEAIYPEDELPQQWIPFKDLNATMAKQYPPASMSKRLLLNGVA